MFSLFIIVVGVLALEYGTLTVLGIINTGVHNDSAPDKKLRSEKIDILLAVTGPVFKGS